MAHADRSQDLVFIHGFQDNATFWQEVIDRLGCPGWTPVPVNLHHKGLGETREQGATLEAYRDQVADAVDAYDGPSARPAVIVGHSMGAQIAELLAVARLHRTVGLVLICPIPLRGYALSADQMSAFETAARTRDPAAAAEGRRQLLVSRAPEVVNTLVAGTLGTPPDAAMEALRAWTDGHPLGVAPSAVTAPTLLITSDDTFATRPLVREQVASRFEHCETAYVPGAGHWPHVEQPAAVARILTDFVNGIANT
ncbi:alpha/beta hydrolase [Streptomyces sp. NPDC055692]|uniref:alpha/beta fold hydrolase n=1 Tax=Streptomyces sp. NPDC055692 TaxID=3155683 RepID=UPI003416DB54